MKNKKGGDQLMAAVSVKTFTNSQGEKSTIPALVRSCTRIKRIKFAYLSANPAETTPKKFKVLSAWFGQGNGKSNVIEHEIEMEMSIGYNDSLRVAYIIMNDPDNYYDIPEGSYDESTLVKRAMPSESFYQFTVPATNIQEIDW